MSIKSGDQVREWQKGLSEAGYEVGKVDGIWGPKTSAATKAFQQDHGFAPDGKVDKQTFDALKEVLAGRTLPDQDVSSGTKPFWKKPLFWVALSGAALVSFTTLMGREKE